MSKDVRESSKLEKAHCSEDPEVQSKEHHDSTVDGVTYRVWSAFLGRKKAVETLGALMLRQLECEEEPASNAEKKPRGSLRKS